MQDKPSTQQKIAQGAFAGLLIGIGVWIALVWRASIVVRSITESTNYIVSIGPLHLSTISKQVTADGYTASISMQAGLAVFCILCLLAGGLISKIAYRFRMGTR